MIEQCATEQVGIIIVLPSYESPGKQIIPDSLLESYCSHNTKYKWYLSNGISAEYKFWLGTWISIISTTFTRPYHSLKLPWKVSTIPNIPNRSYKHILSSNIIPNTLRYHLETFHRHPCLYMKSVFIWIFIWNRFEKNRLSEREVHFLEHNNI